MEKLPGSSLALGLREADHPRHQPHTHRGSCYPQGPGPWTLCCLTWEGVTPVPPQYSCVDLWTQVTELSRYLLREKVEELAPNARAAVWTGCPFPVLPDCAIPSLWLQGFLQGRTRQGWSLGKTDMVAQSFFMFLTPPLLHLQLPGTLPRGSIQSSETLQKLGQVSTLGHLAKV